MTSKLTSIAASCRLLDQALYFIKPLLTPGKTEQQIKRQINRFLKKSGAQGFAFPTIVAFGNHTANIHHRPTNRKLTTNQIVMIDIGVKVGGYCSDATRMFFAGKTQPSWAIAYRQVLHAQQIALNHLRHSGSGRKDSPGVNGAEVDQTVRHYFKKFNLDRHFIHGLGHGIGRAIHQFPRLNPKAKHQVVKPGDVITVEPGLYFKNRFGIRIEDTVLKTRSGYRLLTKFPKDLRSATIKL